MGRISGLLSVYLFVALALPAQALSSSVTARLLAQTVTPSDVPSSVPQALQLRIDGSASMRRINQLLEQQFEDQYAGARVELADNGSEAALQALRSGQIDLAAIGRSLTAEEKAQGLVSVPVSIDKIAIIVGADNPFQKSLTFEQFARIVRGEITDWAELGGEPGPIRFVDRPANSDIRQFLKSYPVFQTLPYEPGRTATAVRKDETRLVIEALGKDGLGFAIASQVMNHKAVKVLPMYSTLPDDPRYPFSQVRSYVYRGEASLAVQTFLKFVTSPEGQAALAQAKEVEAADVVRQTATEREVASDASQSGAGSEAAGAEGQTGSEPTSGSTDNPSRDESTAPSIAQAQPSGERRRAPFWWWLLPPALLGSLLWLMLRDRKNPLDDVVEPVPFDVDDSEPDFSLAESLDSEFFLDELDEPESGAGAGNARNDLTIASRGVAVGPAVEPQPTDPWPDLSSAGRNADGQKNDAQAPDAQKEDVQKEDARKEDAQKELDDQNSDGQNPIGREQEELSRMQALELKSAYETLEDYFSATLRVPLDQAIADQNKGGNVNLPAVALAGGAVLGAGAVAATATRKSGSSDRVVNAISPARIIPLLESPMTDPIDEQSLVEATKYETGGDELDMAALASVDEGLADLPDGYGDSRIVLMPRDPRWAYAYWDIPNSHREELRNQGGQQLALRLYDVTDIDLNNQAPHSLQQYDCDEMARTWYLPVPVSDRDYVIEIGYLTLDDRWLVLARSAPAHIPPVYPSDWIDDKFLSINWNEDLQGKTFAILKRPGAETAELAAGEHPIHDAIFAQLKSADAMRVAGSLFGSMQQVPEQAISSYVFPSGAGMWALPTLSGVPNVSGLTMSGVGFSASAPPIRPRKFWLVADAELIVYGATEPDATVTIGGRVIPLNPDGTFRFHMSFPDGVIDYPIEAVAADGEQTRSIHMTFERSTPERNTNTKAEAQDEWFENP